jgi:uncharacterized protein YegP (UPF0339 family)
MRFELYHSQTGWRWRLKGGNGEIIASGEGYHNRADAVNAVNLVMDTNRQTPFVETPN